MACQSPRHPPAVVDDLFKRREPQRQAAGIYFVTPAPASIAKIVEDWQVGGWGRYQAYLLLAGGWPHGSESIAGHVLQVLVH